MKYLAQLMGLLCGLSSGLASVPTSNPLVLKAYVGASEMIPKVGYAHLISIEAPPKVELIENNGHTLLKHPNFDLRVIVSSATSYTFLKNSALYKKISGDAQFSVYEHSGSVRYILGVREAYKGAYLMCRVDQPRPEDLALIKAMCKSVRYVGIGNT